MATSELEGQWTEHAVEGHPCHVFQPARPHAAGYVVLYLHGVQLTSLRDHPDFVRAFADRGLTVVAPQGGRSWWVDRLCADFDGRYSPEQYLLDHVLPFLASEMNASTPRIALLGTSMGGQGVLRIAYKHPQKFPVVAALAPAIDFQRRWLEGDEVLRTMYLDPEAARQDTAILFVNPLNYPRHQWFACDPDDERWWESADRLQMKLASLGVPHQHDLETRGGGHGFDYYSHMAQTAAQFVLEGLEQERRRLV